VVIDLANSPSFEDQAVLEFFTTSGRNLLAAEAAAGVGHHVALSIVGIDRTDNGYFRAKVAQEKLIVASGIPYTIIRATQFMEFLGGIADSSADRNIVRLPPCLFQPSAADDVAPIVAEVALAAPRRGIVEIAGPERAPFNEIVVRYLKAVGDPRAVVRDPEAPYWGGRVEEHSLVPLGEARRGHIGGAPRDRVNVAIPRRRRGRVAGPLANKTVCQAQRGSLRAACPSSSPGRNPVIFRFARASNCSPRGEPSIRFCDDRSGTISAGPVRIHYWSGCVSKTRSPSGRVTQGCLLRVQKCIVGRSHEVSSNVPALTRRIPSSGLRMLQTQQPQSEHTRRVLTRPLSATL
jgi:hypothetical protein